MKTLLIWLIYSFLLCFIFLSCSTHEPLKDEHVLQVNNTGLREGVFVRRYQMTGDYGNNTTFTGEMLKNYIADVLEPDYLLIQHAYDLGMDKREDIARTLQEYSINLLADNHPVKYQELTIRKTDLHDFYEKKLKSYDVDIIQTPSFHQADSLSGVLRSGNPITLPKARLEGSFPRMFNAAAVVYGEGLHPELLSILLRMTEGETSQPVYAASIWTIMRLNKITDNKALPPFEDIEQALLNQAQALYKYAQQKQLVADLQNTLHVAVDSSLFQSLLNAFTIVDYNGIIDKSKISAKTLTKPLITIGNDKITVADFLAAFNQAASFRQLLALTENDLRSFANDYSAQYCLYMDAEAKGVPQQTIIQDQLKNKEHRLLLSAYLNDEIMKKVTLTDREVQEFYEASPDKWQGSFESVTLNVKSDLRSHKLAERKKEILAALKNKYNVMYNDALLEDLAQQFTEWKTTEMKTK